MHLRNAFSLIEDFFDEDVAIFVDHLRSIEAEVANRQHPAEDATYLQLLDALAEIRTACRRLDEAIGDHADLRSTVQSRYRQAISPWLDQSWFMHRAKTKPCGYPGDYQLLTAIYGRRPRSPGIGGYLDLFFLGTTLARGVYSRMLAARNFLNSEISARANAVRVLNVASGAFREYQQGLRAPQGGQLQITCVDSDPDALRFVKEQVLSPIQAQRGIHVECIRYNALRFSIPRTAIRTFGTFDIIYSIGLLDYLPDRHVVGIVRGLREMLSPSGVLYLSFKDANHYDPTDYQWLVEWYFLQRTEEDCLRLLLEAGFAPAQISLTRDETRSIMNFAASPHLPVQRRIDLPADLETGGDRREVGGGRLEAGGWR